MTVEQLQAYEVLEKRELKDIDSIGYLLKHKKSGARAVLLCNDDDNKVFSIAFRTAPVDSTGVPHIMEHSVLCGSENFPLKDPFVELVKGSLNTFLNAITYPDKTIYPIASCNDQDFHNLMHVYLDAVFHPNIYTNEAIFRQEGWHYELNDQGELVYNGVVYNEMKGAMSNPDDLLQREIYASLYPHTTYSVNSGGDPENIPDLTYEQFLNFHRNYYHPANSYIFLYGNMDMAEKLDFIDKNYLCNYDLLYVPSEINEEPAFEKPVRDAIDFPISEGEDLEENTYLAQMFCVGNGLDREKLLAFKVLDSVLCGIPGAPLKQALLDKGLGMDQYSWFDDGIKQPVFGFVAKGVSLDREEEFLSTIRETLTDLVKNGIDKKSLYSAIHYMEFKYREADFGSTPKGLMLNLRMMDSWLHDDSKPFLYLELNEAYAELKKRVEEGYFEKLIDTYLLYNNHSSVIVLNPVEGLGAKKEAELKDKLARIKDGMTFKELAQVKEMCDRLQAFREKKDAPEDIAKIPLLRREDLRRETAPIVNKESQIGDTFALLHPVFTNGIGYLRLIFRLPELSERELEALSILKLLYMNMNTEHYSYADLNNEINLSTGEMFVTMSNYGSVLDHNAYTMTMEFCAKAMHDELPKAIELMEELILHSDFTDAKRLKEVVSENISKTREYMTSAGHVVAIGRAMSYGSLKDVIDEKVNGIDAYRYLCALDADFDLKGQKLIEDMAALVKKLYRPENLMVDYTGEEAVIMALEPLINTLKARLYTCPVDNSKCSLKAVRRNEGFTTSGQVDYVCRAGNFKEAGFEFTGALNVLRVMMGYEYLWQNIRVKGGAYGCMCNFYRDGGAYFCSYRDPKLSETNEVYEKAAEFVENFQADERTMTQYVIGAIGELDIPMTPASKGRAGKDKYFSGMTQEMQQKSRDQILDAAVEDIRALGAYIRAFMNDNYLCVVGNEQLLRSNLEKFDKIENLF